MESTFRKLPWSCEKQGASLEHLIIKMTNMLVFSISTGGSGGEDRLTENVSLNFSKLNVAYIKQKPTGEPGETLEMSWDIVTNTL